MILANKTLMCPRGSNAVGLNGKAIHEHNTPIIITAELSWSSYGPTIKINLLCLDCMWQANKEISLLKMMERTALCPTNDTSKTGLKDS